MENVEYTEVLINLEDEVFFDCMSELEPYLNDGWTTIKVEIDDTTNGVWVTLRREMNREVA